MIIDASAHHSNPSPSPHFPTSITRPAPDPEKDDVMLQRPRVSRIFYRKHFPYPIGITFLVARRLGILNIPHRHELHQSADVSAQRRNVLDSFYINRFGRRLYKTFFEAYTEKVWGVPCSQIRADWGAQL